jgi:hypothetical protein
MTGLCPDRVHGLSYHTQIVVGTYLITLVCMSLTLIIIAISSILSNRVCFKHGNNTLLLLALVLVVAMVEGIAPVV